MKRAISNLPRAEPRWQPILLFAFLSASAAMQAANLPDPQVVLEEIRAEHNLPALAGAIVTTSGPAQVWVAGNFRAGGDKVLPVHPFHLGSCTKAMTSTLAALLVEQGALRWDSTVGEIFHETAAKLNPLVARATLEQLLTHRAGVIPNLPWGLMPNGDPGALRIAVVHAATAEAPADKASHYSNTGYVIAGAMLEKVTGESWENLMEKRLFTPLGMKGCGFGPAIDGPWPHLPDGKPIDPALAGADNPPLIGPAGTVHASLAAWAEFVAEHLRGAAGEKTRLLSPEGYAKLHTPPEGSDYALGWAVTERGWGGGRVLTHSGSNTVNFCVVWMAPNKKFAVLAATNIGNDDAAKACDQLASKLIGIWKEQNPQ